MSIDTINDLPPRVQYLASASQTVFPYPFPIFQDADLTVEVDGVVKTLTTHYTVSDAGADTGGNVTFLTGQTAGAVVTIYRQTAIERESDFQLNGPMFSTSVNDELDKLTVVAQEQRAATKRCLRVPMSAQVSDTETELSPLQNFFNRYLTFDSIGRPTPAALSAQTMTQETIGSLLYPILPNEVGFNVVNLHYPYGNVKRFGATGDGVTDDTVAIQNCINACIKQYDPTETTHNGNDVTYRGLQTAVFLPAGVYIVTSTINLSFRNDWELYGESEWSTRIEYNGVATNVTIINAKCSNYLRFANISIGGRFKAKRFIHCAGTGVNAVGSKGNVTGNRFSHIFFWNQVGDLVAPFNDWPDHYDHSFAMLDLTTDTGTKAFDDCDDSVVEFCRFAPNSLNNNFGLALGSSAISVNECFFFAANGILANGGAFFTANDCMFAIHAPDVMDSTHNHAAIKYDSAGVFSTISLTNCYFESADYYGVGDTAILVYMAQDPAAPSVGSTRLNLTIQGGLYSINKDAEPYITVGANRFGVINVRNATFQGPNQGYIYAPNCTVNVDVPGLAISADTNSNHPWQPIAAAGVAVKYQTGDFVVRGVRHPPAAVTIQAVDYPARLKFFSIDEALEFVSHSDCDVTITLAKNAEIAIATQLKSNITIALAGFTLTVSAIVKNFGTLTISGAGTAISTDRKLYNYGQLNLVSATVNELVTAISGVVFCAGATFAGTDSSIGIGTYGCPRVIINHDGCTYSGSEYVVDYFGNDAEIILRSGTTTTPTTGKWARGTRFDCVLPAASTAVTFYATANGVGAAAAWKAHGTLAA